MTQALKVAYAGFPAKGMSLIPSRTISSYTGSPSGLVLSGLWLVGGTGGHCVGVACRDLVLYNPVIVITLNMNPPIPNTNTTATDTPIIGMVKTPNPFC